MLASRTFCALALMLAAASTVFAQSSQPGQPNRSSECTIANRWSLTADCNSQPGRLGFAIRTIDRPDAAPNPLGPGGRALSFEAAYTMVGTWRLAGFYSGDATRGNPGTAPGLALPATRSGDSIGVGVVKSATWLSGDRLSLMVSQPLGSTTYRMGGDGPLAASDSASFVGQRPIGLRAQGRDTTAELRYLTPILKSSQIGLSLVNRAGVFESADERIITLRFATQF